MNYLVYIIYPVLLGLILWGIKVFKKEEWNEELMSLGQTKYLQGFMAILIVIHHISQEMCASWQYYDTFPGLNMFVPIGYIFVGVFFFGSGYGLFASYVNKPNYLSKGFLRKRVLPLLIGFYIMNWLFTLVRFFLGQDMNAKTVVSYLTGFGMSDSYTWFALVISLFYLIFYIVFKNCKKNRILIVGITVSIISLVGIGLDHYGYIMCGEWWYNANHLFWIGMVVAKNKDKLFRWAQKNYIFKLIISVLLLAAGLFLAEYARNTFSYYYEGYLPFLQVVAHRWVRLICEMIASAAFVFAILMIGMKVKIGNKVLGFFGTITFELYMAHGLVVELFSYRFCDEVDSLVRITNVALMIVVVFALSIPLALLLKKVCHVRIKSNRE